MIQCARCAAVNQPTSKFCLSCGAALPAPAQQAPGKSAGTAPPPAPPNASAQPSPWGPPGYGPAPGAAPPANPGAYGAPPPAQPYQPPGPSQEDRYRVGAPDGLNPYGATVGPQQGAAPGFGGYGAAPGGPQPGGYTPPPAGPYQPPPPAAPYQPQQPPPANYGQPQPSPYGAQSHEPQAYAPTAPPAREEPDPRANAWGAPQAGALYGQPPGVAPAVAPQPARPGPSRPPPAGRDPELVEPGAQRALAGFLVSYDANELGAFWPIFQGSNVLGRRGAAPGLDIEIDNPTTSSRHAVLYASARPARLKLEDTGSTNGTFLRDQPLERGKKHEIRDGDVVRFGGFATIVKLV